MTSIQDTEAFEGTNVVGPVRCISSGALDLISMHSVDERCEL